MNQSGNGFLRVRVTEATGSLPIRGAIVQISDYPVDEDSTLLYSLRTDENGLTPIVSLPAPAASESLTPGATRPYAVYNVTVKYDGYYPVEDVGIPIFDKITAVQPVNLLPLTEADRIAGADNGRVMIYETPNMASLQPGGLGREDIGNQNGTVSGGIFGEGNNCPPNRSDANGTDGGQNSGGIGPVAGMGGENEQ